MLWLLSFVIIEMKQLPLSNHRQLVLSFLLQHGVVNKSKIGSVITSPPILSRVLESMESDGLLTIKESKIGRKTYKVELTDKGRAVAEQLKKAEDISAGRKVSKFLTDDMKILVYLLNEKETRYESVKERFSGAYGSVSRLKQMKLVGARVDNGKDPSEEIISLTETGMKVAEYLKRIEELLEE